MHLGIDFDNTIANYDRAFYLAARERNLIPKEVAQTKNGVKSFLCGEDRDDDWTELQGYVYGPGIKHATPFPGLIEFLGQVSKEGWRLTVVSHKTRHPYQGPKYDLHGSAAGWIEVQGLSRKVDGIFFETTKEAKLERIAEQRVNAFVDDLPEILDHAAFPVGVRKLLFDPGSIHSGTSHFRIRGWSEACEVLQGMDR